MHKDLLSIGIEIIRLRSCTLVAHFEGDGKLSFYLIYFNSSYKGIFWGAHFITASINLPSLKKNKLFNWRLQSKLNKIMIFQNTLRF